MAPWFIPCLRGEQLISGKQMAISNFLFLSSHWAFRWARGNPEQKQNPQPPLLLCDSDSCHSAPEKGSSFSHLPIAGRGPGGRHRGLWGWTDHTLGSSVKNHRPDPLLSQQGFQCHREISSAQFMTLSSEPIQPNLCAHNCPLMSHHLPVLKTVHLQPGDGGTCL